MTLRREGRIPEHPAEDKLTVGYDVRVRPSPQVIKDVAETGPQKMRRHEGP